MLFSQRKRKKSSCFYVYCCFSYMENLLLPPHLLYMYTYMSSKKNVKAFITVCMIKNKKNQCIPRSSKSNETRNWCVDVLMHQRAHPMSFRKFRITEKEEKSLCQATPVTSNHETAKLLVCLFFFFSLVFELIQRYRKMEIIK